MVGFIFWQTEVYIEIDRHIEYTKGEADGNTPKDSPFVYLMIISSWIETCCMFT